MSKCPWYVVHCNAHADGQVERLMQSFGLEAYSPQIPRTRRWNGHKPLFPGYIFVRLDPSGPVWSRLRSMPGVRSLVGVGDVPTPVSDEIVTVIRDRTAGLSQRVRRLQPGDAVAVVRGPLSDLEGVFCESLSGEERVVILLDVMQRQTRVALPKRDIVPVVDEAVA